MFFKIFLFLSIIIVLLFSLSPTNLIDQKLFTHSDKVKHIIAFFTISFFLYQSKFYSNTINFGLLIIFALLIEILQLFVGREATFLDFIFSSLGIFFYLFFSKIIKNF